MNRLTVLSLSAVSMAVALTACGGSGSSASGVSNTLPVTPQVVVADGMKCPSDHGVSVKPCMVKLSVTKPSQTVTTKGPKGGTFSYKDTKCTKKNIAEVEGTGNNYTVTAGTASGSCSAVFTEKAPSGNVLGKATLNITNKV